MSSPSTSRKRARDGEADSALQNCSIFNSSSSFEDTLTFSDTLVALRMMRAQFPAMDKVAVEPFILRSQLYSSLKDRTQVDRELELLKQDNVLRIFKLNTGQDDDAVMFMDDYINQIGRAVKKFDSKGEDEIKVFDWFKTHVLYSKREPSIGHDELLSLLSVGGPVNDESISLLINAGLLTRKLIDANLFWFAIPNIGSILKGISQGRKELLSLLKRTKYKEMMLTPLEKKRLRYSPLDMRFHLRDLIGSVYGKANQSRGGYDASKLWRMGGNNRDDDVPLARFVIKWTTPVAVYFK
uniref:Serine/threonine-protein kinase 19 n=1 Tax=Kalanchoe fedtschenkoi TaxID=63787 RepID=A0A7N0ULF5_KALFE